MEGNKNLHSVWLDVKEEAIECVEINPHIPPLLEKTQSQYTDGCSSDVKEGPVKTETVNDASATVKWEPFFSFKTESDVNTWNSPNNLNISSATSKPLRSENKYSVIKVEMDEEMKKLNSAPSTNIQNKNPGSVNTTSTQAVSVQTLTQAVPLNIIDQPIPVEMSSRPNLLHQKSFEPVQSSIQSSSAMKPIKNALEAVPVHSTSRARHKLIKLDSSVHGAKPAQIRHRTVPVYSTSVAMPIQARTLVVPAQTFSQGTSVKAMPKVVFVPRMPQTIPWSLVSLLSQGTSVKAMPYVVSVPTLPQTVPVQTLSQVTSVKVMPQVVSVPTLPQTVPVQTFSQGTSVKVIPQDVSVPKLPKTVPLPSMSQVTSMKAMPQLQLLLSAPALSRPLQTMPVQSLSQETSVKAMPHIVSVPTLPQTAPMQTLSRETSMKAMPHIVSVPTLPQTVPMQTLSRETSMKAMPHIVSVPTLPQTAPMQTLSRETSMKAMPHILSVPTLPQTVPMQTLSRETSVKAMPHIVSVPTLPQTVPVQTLSQGTTVKAMPHVVSISTLPQTVPMQTLSRETSVKAMPHVVSVPTLPQTVPVQTLSQGTTVKAMPHVVSVPTLPQTVPVQTLSQGTSVKLMPQVISEPTLPQTVAVQALSQGTSVKVMPQVVSEPTLPQTVPVSLVSLLSQGTSVKAMPQVVSVPTTHQTVVKCHINQDTSESSEILQKSGPLIVINKYGILQIAEGKSPYQITLQKEDKNDDENKTTQNPVKEERIDENDISLVPGKMHHNLPCNVQIPLDTVVSCQPGNPTSVPHSPLNAPIHSSLSTAKTASTIVLSKVKQKCQKRKIITFPLAHNSPKKVKTNTEMSDSFYERKVDGFLHAEVSQKPIDSVDLQTLHRGTSSQALSQTVPIKTFTQTVPEQAVCREKTRQALPQTVPTKKSTQTVPVKATSTEIPLQALPNTLPLQASGIQIQLPSQTLTLNNITFPDINKSALSETETTFRKAQNLMSKSSPQSQELAQLLRNKTGFPVQSAKTYTLNNIIFPNMHSDLLSSTELQAPQHNTQSEVIDQTRTIFKNESNLEELRLPAPQSKMYTQSRSEVIDQTRTVEVKHESNLEEYTLTRPRTAQYNGTNDVTATQVVNIQIENSAILNSDNVIVQQTGVRKSIVTEPLPTADKSSCENVRRRDPDTNVAMFPVTTSIQCSQTSMLTRSDTVLPTKEQRPHKRKDNSTKEDNMANTEGNTCKCSHWNFNKLQKLPVTTKKIKVNLIGGAMPHSKGSICKECNQQLSSPLHSLFMTCNFCPFSTLCIVSMTGHQKSKHGPMAKQLKRLKGAYGYLIDVTFPEEMVCGCGEKWTKNCNEMVKHLSRCTEGKKTCRFVNGTSDISEQRENDKFIFYNLSGSVTEDETLASKSPDMSEHKENDQFTVHNLSRSVTEDETLANKSQDMSEHKENDQFTVHNLSGSVTEDETLANKSPDMSEHKENDQFTVHNLSRSVTEDETLANKSPDMSEHKENDQFTVHNLSRSVTEDETLANKSPDMSEQREGSPFVWIYKRSKTCRLISKSPERSEQREDGESLVIGCGLCDVKCSSYLSLSQHLRYFHPAKYANGFICLLCDIGIVMPRMVNPFCNLKRHQSKNHGGKHLIYGKLKETGSSHTFENCNILKGKKHGTEEEMKMMLDKAVNILNEIGLTSRIENLKKEFSEISNIPKLKKEYKEILNSLSSTNTNINDDQIGQFSSTLRIKQLESLLGKQQNLQSVSKERSDTYIKCMTREEFQIITNKAYKESFSSLMVGCGICAEKFSTYTFLEEHVNNCYVCMWCNVKIAERAKIPLFNLRRHQNKSHGGKYLIYGMLKECQSLHTLVNCGILKGKHHGTKEEMNIMFDKAVKILSERGLISEKENLTKEFSEIMSAKDSIDNQEGQRGKDKPDNQKRTKRKVKFQDPLICMHNMCGKEFTGENRKSLILAHLYEHWYPQETKDDYSGDSTPKLRTKNEIDRFLRQILPSCNLCHRKMGKDENVKTHMIQHHLSVKCNVCTKVFLRKSIPGHMQTHEKNGRWQCDKCGRVFKNCRSLQHHQREVCTSVMCELCGVIVNRRNYNNHKQVHENKRSFKCVECGKGFNTLAVRWQHMRNRHRIKSDDVSSSNFECDTCNMKFMKLNSLHQHLKRVHIVHAAHSSLNSVTENKSYLCSVCGKTLNSLKSYKSHMESHSENKSFLCLVCGKTLSLNSFGNYKRHMELHKDPNPAFHCKICNKYFKAKRLLYHHNQMSHPKNVNRYTCTYCKKKFTWNFNLKRHVKTKHMKQKNVQCTLCNYRCYDFCRLKSHMQFRHKTTVLK